MPPLVVCILLQCRDEWISSLIDELDDTQDAYEHAKHLTDIHRLHLFDAVMQYRAIFFGSSAGGATSTGPGSQAPTNAALLQVRGAAARVRNVTCGYRGMACGFSRMACSCV